MWLVLRGSLTLILAGIAIGVPLTLAASRFIESQLYGLSPYDPVALLKSILALGLAVLIASLVPALRASSISPLNALRSQ